MAFEALEAGQVHAQPAFARIRRAAARHLKLGLKAGQTITVGTRESTHVVCQIGK